MADRTRSLATAIRAARQQAGISQEQLARLVGVRQGAVSMWERGRTEPSGWRMAGLLGALPWLGDLLDAQITQVGGRPARMRAS